MQAELFYQSTTEHTVPLILLNPGSHDNMSPYELSCMELQQFKGKLGDICLISDAEGALLKAYIGIGNGDATYVLAHVVNRLPAGHYSTVQRMTSTTMLSWSLAQYKFDRYKKNTARPRVLSIPANELSAIQAESLAVFIVRDLINTPTNDMGPEDMANVMAQLARDHHAEFKQWVGDELLTHNFPAIHAVGRAAATPPRLLSLTWGDASHPKVTLIGKGVCFDSGGLDLKSSSNMRLMKKDMGGAAQVIGLAALLMMRNVPIRLHVLVPAVENAIGSNAYRPGDVLTMRNGLTVEIDNTDAEGRLVVADALVKACEENPELIIDFTTLTGAARVAVGTEISALFTNADTFAQSLTERGCATHDHVWRMPLHAGYESMLDSSIADLTNSSPSAYAGAIIAALFLQRFVTKGIDWAHFDIMAWNVSNKPGRPEGGEAMGLRAVAAYLIGRYGVP